MFTADAIIDTVQTGKKTFVNTFVTNETVKDSMIKFIDAQADYTKKAAKVGMDTVTTVTSEAVKVYQNATKFDYTKFGEGIMKAYQTTQAKAK
jgi:ATP phosphoribosyltransferase